MYGITRRRFVKRSGVALGAAGLANVSWAAGASAATGLSPARRAAYSALFVAVREANAIPVDGRMVAEAVTAFEGDYGVVHPATRTYIDSVLDEVEPGTLREWRHGKVRHDEPGATDLSRRRRAFAGAAVVWASCPTALSSEFKVVPLPI